MVRSMLSSGIALVTTSRHISTIHPIKATLLTSCLTNSPSEFPHCVTMTVFDKFPSATNSWLDFECGGDDFTAHTVYREMSPSTSTAITESSSAPTTNSPEPSQPSSTAAITSAPATLPTPRAQSATSNNKALYAGLGVLGGVVAILLAIGYLGFRKLRTRTKGTSHLPTSGHGSLNPLTAKNNNNNNDHPQRPSLQHKSSTETDSSTPTVINFHNHMNHMANTGGPGLGRIEGRFEGRNTLSSVVNMGHPGSANGSGQPGTTPVERAAGSSNRPQSSDVPLRPRPVSNRNQTDPVLSGRTSKDAPEPGALVTRGHGTARAYSAPANVHQLANVTPRTPELDNSRPLLRSQDATEGGAYH